MLILTRRFQVFWALYLIGILAAIGVYSTIRISSPGTQADRVTQSPVAVNRSQQGRRLVQPEAAQPLKAQTLKPQAVEAEPQKVEPHKAEAVSKTGSEAVPRSAGNRQTGSPPALAWPVKGAIVSRHGMQYSQTMGDWRWHNGIDIRADIGSAVRASADGLVEAAQLGPEWQGDVVVEHRDGWRTLYAGCGQPVVSAGARVSKGQTICYIGSPGFAEVATGPHLHFELIAPGVSAAGEGGKPVDPLPLLR